MTRRFCLALAIDCAWIRTQHWVVAARGGGLVLNLTVSHPGEVVTVTSTAGPIHTVISPLIQPAIRRLTESAFQTYWLLIG